MPSAKSMVFEVTKFADTKYKGEARSGYSATGGGIGFEVSIDPGKIIGMQASIGVSGKVTRATQCMIIAHRAPLQFVVNEGTPSVDSAGSLVLNNFVGACWQGQAGVSAEVGISAKAGFGAGEFTNSKGESVSPLEVRGSTGTHATATQDSKSCSVEWLSASAQVKAGLSLNASGTYSHYYGKCFAPLYYDDYDDMKETLEGLLKVPKLKAKLKQDAIQFINKNKMYFGLTKDLSYSSRMGMSHISSSALVEHLDRGLASMEEDFARRFGSKELPKPQASALAKIRTITGLLSPGRDRSMAFMHISSKNGTAGMKLGASATASMAGGGFGEVGAAIEANLVEMEYNKTWTHIRFQSHEKREALLWTHDSTVVYNNSKIHFLTGKASAGAKVFHKSASASKSGAAFKPVDYNWVSYESSIIYWKKPQEPNKPVVPEKGSGIAQGRSYSIETLYAMYLTDASKVSALRNQGSTPAPSTPKSNLLGGRARSSGGTPPRPTLRKTNMLLSSKLAPKTRVESALFVNTDSPTFATICSSLKVDGAALELFFNDEFVRFMISDLFHKDELSKKLKKAPIGGAFIEVAYHKPESFKKVTLKRGDQVELDVNSSKQLREAFGTLSDAQRRKLLCCIRLRVRQRDLEDKSGTLFSIGFKHLGTGAKINIERVDKAACGGFVELRSVFLKHDGTAYKVTCDTNHGGKYVVQHEISVPPANLYCQ